jgi:hypothetical protein
MIAFEILVSGKRVCVAGGALVTSVGIDWSDRDPDAKAIRLHVGGIDDPSLREHLRWDAPTLQVGDEVTVRILSTDEIDPPIRYRPDQKAPA